MADAVKVDSIDALRHFRVAIFKFAESAQAALNDADADMHSMFNWLENEQLSHWTTQIRKRTELVARCKDAVRQKKLFKDSSGRTPSAVEEEKALAIAQRRLEEAEQKLQATRKYIRVLQKEIQNYKGSVQRFASTLEAELPVATAMLDQLVTTLEAYVALDSVGDSAAPAASSSGSSQTPPPPIPDSAEAEHQNGGE